MIEQQGSQVAQPVPRPQPVRQFCFLGAFCCLLLYQFQTRPVGVWRWRSGETSRSGV
jgi:hypothetical protein